jgi:hypothetical protein
MATKIELGHAMITMVEPHADTLHEYNEWYEGDHAYSGVMAGPGAFAYRRFVATRDLKPLRIAGPNPVADPKELGSFIALYWVERDQVEPLFAWSFALMPQLVADGRMHPGRDHISTAVYDLAAEHERDGGVPARIALDHPFPGVIVTWTDAVDAAHLDELAEWYRTEGLPAGGPIGTAVGWALREFPGTPSTVPATVGVGTRLVHTAFTTVDPRECWDEVTGDLVARLEKSGLGTLSLAAPFIPVVPGTTTYLDQLW